MNPTKILRALTLAALIAIFLLMALGNVVRATGASNGCPDWPTCFGVLIPPAETLAAAPQTAGLQVAHRVLAALAGLLLAAGAAWGRVKAQTLRATWLTLALAALVSAGQALLGGGLVRGGAENATLSALHLTLALAAFGLTTWATVTVFWTQPRLRSLRFASPFARLTLATAAGMALLMISGVLTREVSASACAAWPVCVPTSGAGWLAMGHRVVVAAALLLAAAQFTRAWQTQRTQRAVLTGATAALLLMVGQAWIGALNVSRGLTWELTALHAAGSAALWAAQIVAVAAAGLSARTAQDEAQEVSALAGTPRKLKDFLLLNKPIIVLLLLATTYAGMVVGGRSIPDAGLTAWTMLGGFLAAGGSSALNQYIDRETDKAMQRTALRPLPDGKLQPAEGLAYGVGAVLASFYLLAGTVNLLTALLSLLGMVYYVLIYSVWLKYATVQNIVIGGGAGAIPPLVGWAASTGSLNVPSLFLFAIIFLWTPPHFWALALVRTKDYARGKVPMLPVIRGEKETRRQIMIYTLELVALTLLLPLFNLAGTVYLVSAAVLGAWMIHTAWKVLRGAGNKDAFKMYRYSSMYLAFLMLAMVVDVLV